MHWLKTVNHNAKTVIIQYKINPQAHDLTWPASRSEKCCNLVPDIACSLSQLLLHDVYIIQLLHTCKKVCLIILVSVPCVHVTTVRESGFLFNINYYNIAQQRDFLGHWSKSATASRNSPLCMWFATYCTLLVWWALLLKRRATSAGVTFNPALHNSKLSGWSSFGQTTFHNSHWYCTCVELLIINSIFRYSTTTCIQQTTTVTCIQCKQKCWLQPSRPAIANTCPYVK